MKVSNVRSDRVVKWWNYRVVEARLLLFLLSLKPFFLTTCCFHRKQVDVKLTIRMCAFNSSMNLKDTMNITMNKYFGTISRLREYVCIVCFRRNVQFSSSLFYKFVCEEVKQKSRGYSIETFNKYPIVLLNNFLN